MANICQLLGVIVSLLEQNNAVTGNSLGFLALAVLGNGLVGDDFDLVFGALFGEPLLQLTCTFRTGNFVVGTIGIGGAGEVSRLAGFFGKIKGDTLFFKCRVDNANVV